MRDSLGIDDRAIALDPRLQDWKYWTPHPVDSNSRGRVLTDGHTILAHGGIWPIPLQTATNVSNAFHLIDWAASRESPGAGMKVLRECSVGMTAAFSIGGSDMTRKILPAFGFKPYNALTFLQRPLKPVRLALQDSPLDWKTPARAARNLWHALHPFGKALEQGWRASRVELTEIPETLWPMASDTMAVSRRSTELLAHACACPAVRGSACVLMETKDGPAAYMLLLRVRDQVRLADYGPAESDEETCRALGLMAQAYGRSLFPDATAIVAATSEPHARAGFVRAGFRTYCEETIKVLKLGPSLAGIDRFRVTMLDWDALFL